MQHIKSMVLKFHQLSCNTTQKVNMTQEEESKPAENLCSKFIAQTFSHLETSIRSIPVLIQYIWTSAGESKLQVVTVNTTILMIIKTGTPFDWSISSCLWITYC